MFTPVIRKTIFLTTFRPRVPVMPDADGTSNLTEAWNRATDFALYDSVQFGEESPIALTSKTKDAPIGLTKLDFMLAYLI